MGKRDPCAARAVSTVQPRRTLSPRSRPATTLLPFGNGRSYGDSGLNVGGALLQTRSLDRFIAFDRESGVLACEAGVLLADILQLIVPAGWFLPVVPGTCYVTVGGAVANDVHGKNHHSAGTFGRHVRRLELLRSDGTHLLCSTAENPDWFAATVGGLGLSGLVTWAEIQLRRIAGPRLDVDSIRFANLDEFFALCDESEKNSEYTVAWIDCLSRGKHLGAAFCSWRITRRRRVGRAGRRQRVERALYAAGVARQRPVTARFQHALLPSPVGPAETHEPALPLLLFPSRQYPALEPVVWPEGLLSIPVRHSARRCPRGDSSFARDHRRQRHGLISRGPEASRLRELARHAVVSSRRGHTGARFS